MIKSISKPLYKVCIPDYLGEIKMLPFELDMSNILDIPEQFRKVVIKMIQFLPKKEGTAWLTVDGRVLEVNKSHRRGGAHIDGNYIVEMCGWGSSPGTGGNGWKVGENGRALDTKEHKLSYENNTGGMLIASNYSLCKGWNGIFDGKPGIGGDCRHINLNRGFKLESHVVYYGNSQFIHESLPAILPIHRTLVRITLPLDHVYS